MNQLAEALEFIESDTMREFLQVEAQKERFTLNEEQMCSIVWNSRQALSMKETFLLGFPELPCAIDLIKRMEAVRLYLQENHENEVYVLLVNDRFYGVYNRYDVAKEEFQDFQDFADENAEITLELYDVRGSRFRGRLFLDETFEITAFDFSKEVVETEKLWNNADTDRVVNLYIQLPHPFETGDIVGRKRSFDTYKIVNPEQPQDLFGELNAGDMQVEVVPYDEDEEDLSDLADADAELVEPQHESIPLLQLELL